MKVEIENNVITVTRIEQTPALVKKLIAKLKRQTGIRSDSEIAKLFFMEGTRSSGRNVQRWTSDPTAGSFRPMPPLAFELLLHYTGEDKISSLVEH